MKTIHQTIVSLAAMLLTAPFAGAQTYQPTDQYDSPTADIFVGAIDPSLGESTVYGLYSHNYGLVNGIASNISINVETTEDFATGAGFFYINDTQSDISLKNMGTLGGNITVSSAVSATGMVLNTVKMAAGAEISANISAHGGTYGGKGLSIWDIEGTAADQHYVVSGTIRATTDSVSSDSYNYAITLTQQKDRIFELKNATLYTEGPRAYGIYADRAIDNLVLTGNNHLETKGTVSDYVICAPGDVTIFGDVAGTQKFVGGVYAISSGSSNLTFKTGNFVIDSNGAQSLFLSKVANIEKGVKMDIHTNLYFAGASSTGSYRNATLINGDLVLHAKTLTDFAKIITQDSDLTVGADASLTLVLSDGFSYEVGDSLTLVLNAKGTDTVSGSFADNFTVMFEDGTVLGREHYTFDGFTLTFVPEPAELAAALGLLALGFAAYRRKK